MNPSSSPPAPAPFQNFPAPAKINLFLHIVGQRTDGYHLLQTAFQLLDFHDTIQIRVTPTPRITRVAGNADIAERDDLVVRAAQLLQRHAQCPLGAEIRVKKRIPMGGGLGGGSSDAATVLLALNQLWQLQLRRTELQALALQLGADVPIFVFGRSAWAEGIGERLQSIDLEPRHYLVLTPHIQISTASIFASRELTRNTIPTTIAAFSRNADSGRLFYNDLESIVTKQYPVVAQCMAWLNTHAHARMSGSGASVFAAFSTQEAAKNAYNTLPEQIAGVRVSGFVASSLTQHPLYALAH